jgi:hypothetical protein
MSTYDVTPDDEPLDVGQVASDDALIEQLRQSLSPDNAVVWDDNDDESDPGYALLRAIQLDVSQDLPMPEILPTGVTPLLPRRRHLSRTATIATVAAGVLSIGGVAAASAPGQPLAGVRHAVSDAVATAVDAITPDSPVGPAVKPTDVAVPSAKPTPPGDAVSDAARSANAVLQIEDNLARAAAMLDKGQLEAARAQLDAVERKLVYVTDAAVRAGFQTRLDDLRTKLATAPTAKPTKAPASDGKGSGKGNGGAGNTAGPSATHTPNVNSSKGGEANGSDDHGSLNVHSKATDMRSTHLLPGDSTGKGGRGNSDRG